MVIYNVTVAQPFNFLESVVVAVQRDPIPFLLFSLYTGLLFVFLNSLYDYIKDPKLEKNMKQRLRTIMTFSFICLLVVSFVTLELGYIGNLIHGI
jgi:D-alanyl-lipoteichoic acid acyltransferase DltB (MBOAT superfamily)